MISNFRVGISHRFVVLSSEALPYVVDIPFREYQLSLGRKTYWVRVETWSELSVQISSSRRPLSFHAAIANVGGWFSDPGIH